MNSRLRFGSSVPGARLRLPRGAPGAAAVVHAARRAAVPPATPPSRVPSLCPAPSPSPPHLHLRGTAPCSQISPYDVDDALIS